MQQVSLFPLPESSNPLNSWLSARFPEVATFDFYRELFPEGSLEKAGEIVSGKYRGVAIRIREGRARRFSVSDGLEILDEVTCDPKDFWLLSPVSYAGRSQKQEFARFLYAVAVDLDGVRIETVNKPRGLEALFNQIEGGLQPRPTFIVSSGTGLHLYYFLKKPIALYKPVIRQLQKFRHDLIKKVWSSFVTDQWQRPQYESATQGFRIVGSATKNGNMVRAWRTGERVDIDYLNRWVEPDNQLSNLRYQSRLTLQEAKEKYPDWYQSRIVEGRPRGSWVVNRRLYEWWRDKKIGEATVGHRYFYLMCLAVYAVKCGICRDELEKDAFKAAKLLRALDTSDNPLLDSDVIKALELYDANFQTFPRRTIEALTAIQIPENKRNGRKQSQHLKIARMTQQIDDPSGSWRNKNGAPTKKEAVKKWRKKNPNGLKIDCHKETGISRVTINKWWNA